MEPTNKSKDCEEDLSEEQVIAQVWDKKSLTPLGAWTDESQQSFINKLENERLETEFIADLERMPLLSAIQLYLSNLRPETKRNYSYYFQDMRRRKIIFDTDANGNVFTVGHFNRVRHEFVLDYIKKVAEWEEGTKQLKAACYISLTNYLERISRGWFRPAKPNTLASNPTFFQIRDKCATKALTLSEWHRFIDALTDLNKRDSLIARCLFQGAKRISEALTLTLDQISLEENIIRFRQHKTGGVIKEIPITYPAYFMKELSDYISDTREQREESKFIFITKSGKPVTRCRINFAFDQASRDAGIRKVTPHMLRATWVTLVKGQGVADTDIMKVTGHTNAKSVYAYDKSSIEDNLSKKLILI